MTSSETIKIGFRRAKMAFLMLPGALIFVALGVFFLFFTEEVLIQVIGVISILFFGACMGAILFMLFRSGYSLEVSEEGILDKSNVLAAGFIPWSDITGIYLTTMQGNQFVTIMVHNLNEYSNRGNIVLRWLKKANIGLVGSPINIPLQAVNMGAEELLEVLHQASGEL